LHGFDLTFEEAREIQRELASKLITVGGPAIPEIHTIAGCDCAFDKRSNRIFGALVVLSFPKMEILAEYFSQMPIKFPYVPGYLSFRELEVLVELFEKLLERPDVVFVDGQGIAHPRGIGLASHLGLFLDLPTVGCAKSRLVGDCAEPSAAKGSWEPIKYSGKIVGSLLRTRNNTKPMFISPGHLIGVDKARELTLTCALKFRIPEPTRIADKAVAKYKKEMLDE